MGRGRYILQKLDGRSSRCSWSSSSTSSSSGCSPATRPAPGARPQAHRGVGRGAAGALRAGQAAIPRSRRGEPVRHPVLRLLRCAGERRPGGLLRLPGPVGIRSPGAGAGQHDLAGAPRRAHCDIPRDPPGVACGMAARHQARCRSARVLAVHVVSPHVLSGDRPAVCGIALARSPRGWAGHHRGILHRPLESDRGCGQATCFCRR